MLGNSRRFAPGCYSARKIDPQNQGISTGWRAVRLRPCVPNNNLSANRHRPHSRTKVEHRDPREILDELRGFETEILEEIDKLSEAVRGAVAE